MSMLLTVWPSPPTAADLSVLDNILSSGAVLVSLILVVLSVSDRVRQLLARGRLRRATWSMRLRRGGKAPSRDVRKAIRHQYDEKIRLERGAAGAFVSAVSAMEIGSSQLERVTEWLKNASQRSSDPLVARLLAPVETEAFSALLRSTHRILAEQAFQPTTANREFSTFASALSGAAVLMDCSERASGTADRVMVRHVDKYRGLGQGDTYHAAHRGGQNHCGHTDMGVHDGRNLELLGASVRTFRDAPGVELVLDTAETCYLSTEDETNGCKKLSASSHDDLLPRFEVRNGSVIRRPERVENERRLLLTSYLTLMARTSDDDDAEDVLVLCRRSGRVLNGRHTLSATAGGVVEPGSPSAPIDRDGDGVPDVTNTALREAVEEIGVPRDTIHPRPVCTFVATLMGRDASAATGQVVASVLHLAPCTLTVPQIRASQSRADLGLGAFEVDRLETIRLPREGAAGGASTFAKNVHARASSLDQHGLLSCLYASLVRYGKEDTMDAFAAAFDLPWWMVPWEGPEPYGNRGRRVARDWRHVMSRSSREDWPKETPRTWREETFLDHQR